MHSWDVTIREATEIQKDLRRHVQIVPLPSHIRTIAGADISFSRFSDIFHACVVVLSYPDLVVIDRSFKTMQVTFPYVSGYLSFREVPSIVDAYNALTHKPDVLIADGQGITHPRSVGLATHLGLTLGIPTIGCAKSRLFGEGDMPGEEPGCISYMHHPHSGETLGAYLRTKKRSKPIIVSPGHLADVGSSLSLMRSCVRGYRIPEPTRLAHVMVNEYRKEFHNA